MKNIFGTNDRKIPEKKDNAYTSNGQPVESHEDRASQLKGAFPKEYPTNGAMDYNAIGYNALWGSNSNDSKEDGVKSVVDTIIGYQRDIAPEINSVTVISRDAQITGELKTKGDLNFMGIIDGNIETQGSMNSSGTINGNVSAGSISLAGGKITGEYLQVSDRVMIDENSNIECNVTTGSLNASGHIKGDVIAKQTVELNETAVMTGNISAKYITIKEGARVTGTLKIGPTE